MHEFNNRTNAGKLWMEHRKRSTHANTGSYFKENDYGVWSIWSGYWNSAFRWPEGEMFLLGDLRTAIADHDRIDTCSDIANHISPNTKVIDHG